MSDESDVKILVELSHLTNSLRAYGEGQARVSQQIEGLRSDVHSIAERVNHVEERMGRTEGVALEAKRLADVTKLETGQVHKAWQVHAEALRVSVENVKKETESQTAALVRQEASLEKLIEADERAELHRQWQRDQAAEAERRTLARRATATWVLGLATAIIAIIGAIYAALVAMRVKH